MSALVEIVLEILLEGAIGAAGSKQVSLPVRILLWAVLLALFVVFLPCWSGWGCVPEGWRPWSARRPFWPSAS